MPDGTDRKDRERLALPAAETRRRRREVVLIIVTAVAFAILAVFETRLPQFGDRSSLAGNVTFFLLINLNLILLILLIFLVSRNFVKLLFERRRGVLGSRLRTRLVLAFVSLALFPTLLLFLVAEGFVGTAIDNWFGSRVGTALTESLEVAHRYYQEAGNDALHHASVLARKPATIDLLAPGRSSDLQSYLEAMRSDLNVSGLVVVFADGTSVVSREEVVGRRLAPVSSVDVESVLHDGKTFARTQRASPGDVVRAGAPIGDAAGQNIGVLVVETMVPSSVSRAAKRVGRSHDEVRQLAAMKQPIENGYTLTFLLITLVVLFSGSWFGFYFAKGFTGPIQRLGEGMKEVAQGNWNYRAEPGGDEEIATLVTSFNQMTAELETIHSALEERRRYIENVLANITAGVVSIDEWGAIATVNPAAGAMFGIRPSDVSGRPWRQVFAGNHLQPVADLLTLVTEDRQDRVEQQVRLTGGQRVLTAWVTATSLTDDTGVAKGAILFLEDVTHLLRVERMEAWREVARRIAHEIKNPLTPIQLSAQRLRKRYASRLSADEHPLLDECTSTIIGQVEQLKRLVNEFSTFARLPAVEVAPNDLNRVVEEALVLFHEGDRDIAFEFLPDRDLPVVDVDADAIRRMLVNLLDNAVSACQAAGSEARIQLRTKYVAERGLVRLEVEDNGIGMSSDVKARAFEPYFSTKKEGTGLGLAIVSSIVSDHQAYLRIRDHAPHGTCMVVEFPVRNDAPLRAVARV